MLDFGKSSIIGALLNVLIRSHYPLSLRHTEEMMQERSDFVDHATVHPWAIKMVTVVAAVFRRCKHPVGKSWRMDTKDEQT